MPTDDKMKSVKFFIELLPLVYVIIIYSSSKSNDELCLCKLVIIETKLKMNLINLSRNSTRSA